MLISEVSSSECLKIFKIFWIITAVTADFLHENYPATVIEDATLDTPRLLKKYKHPVSTHYVITEDKYILCMHRIPKAGGRPIFLMHGLLDASATWIFMGPHSGLAYYLHELGYDVWLGNARGNRYSRNHTHYNPNTDKKFWEFSFHEIGFYDLPAMIDYVLQQTNHKKLSYVGHSQGTTSFFVMCATRPDYKSKINSMQALAPVAFMKHLKAPLLAVAERAIRMVDSVVREFLPHNDFLLNTFCFQSQNTLNICTEAVFQFVGKETKEANATMWPVVFGHVPAGAAVGQVKHYLQLIHSDRFCQYDFGTKENMKRYGKTTPPEYFLENITVPIGLYYTYNDYLASEVDVVRLSDDLPNVAENILYPHKEWNHVTVIWGINARKQKAVHIPDSVRYYNRFVFMQQPLQAAVIDGMSRNFLF